jgi:pimeloyl-ACP methyl ester carboxylesterase
MNANVVTLRNAQGLALHCVLHEPAGKAEPRFAAVLLCPGIKTRVGPHRLYRKLVPPFIERGIPVLRVDFRGLGDSEGEWPDESIEQIYRLTELGHCVDDARRALDWLESRFGIRQCIVGGLCGGAITALHLATQDRRLAALYAIGLPVRLDGPFQQHGASKGELRSQRSRFLRKLRRPGSWMRFLSLRSDYRLLWRAFVQAPRKPRDTAPDLNPHLPIGFLALVRAGRPALLMFGERDPSRWDFEEKFFQPWSAALEPYRELISYSVIPRANHVLGDPDAVVAATRLTGAWLDAHFGLVAARAAASGWLYPATLKLAR